MWIHYIGGHGKSGRLVAVGIGMSPDPEVALAKFDGQMPFSTSLLGLETGSRERLEALRTQFQAAHLHGPWFKPNEALEAHIGALKPVDRELGKPRRVSLDLTADEFLDLEQWVEELGTVTKSRLIRRAIRFYIGVGKYVALGYRFQAIKDGSLIQFPDLDIPEP